MSIENAKARSKEIENEIDKGGHICIFLDYNTHFWNQIDFEAIWGEPHRRGVLSKDPDNRFLIE